MTEPDHWIGTWSTTPAPADRTAFNNQTLRMNARVSIEGQVHTSTPDQRHGTGDLHIGAARIALLAGLAGIMPGTGRTLTFNGAKSATIAALDPPNGMTTAARPYSADPRRGSKQRPQVPPGICAKHSRR